MTDWDRVARADFEDLERRHREDPDCTGRMLWRVLAAGVLFWALVLGAIYGCGCGP